jgi:NAD(P)-dependent dehydrogenase (short-subunit alcohol dehydrogenase family)
MTTVLITGCSTGFGLESALAFARRGDTTYASMRNPAKADKLRERADAEGLTVEIATLDVTDDESVAAAVAEIESRHGAVDVLVNNAGVGYSGAVEAIDMDRARALMETNVWGAVRTMRAVLPAMRAQGSGVIVNVSSVAGRVPASGHHGFYAASKHALNALTEAAATELEHFGVRVVSVEPGFFKTEIANNSDMEADIDDASPYAADHRWINKFYENGVGETGDDPAVVADATVRAATDTNAPIHNLVGDDAVMFVDMVAQAGSLEAWLPIGISVVEGVAGPRPCVPSAGGTQHAAHQRRDKRNAHGATLAP